MTHFKSAFMFSILRMLQVVSASPLDVGEQITNVVEVVPGPGLRSLEELGITSTDLFRPDYLESRGLSVPKLSSNVGMANSDSIGSPRNETEPRAAQYAATCVYNSGVAGSRGNAIACRNYLITNGNTYCDIDVTSDYSVLCTAGDTEIVGWNYYDVAGALLAYCSDVAVGAAWIIDNCSSCTDDSCAVEGSQLANGSQNFVVYIEHSP